MINLIAFTILFSILLIFLFQRIKVQIIKNTFISIIIIFLGNLIYLSYFYKVNFLNLIMYINILISFYLILIIILQSYKSSIQIQILKDHDKTLDFLKKDKIIFKNRLLNLSKNKIIEIKKKNIYINRKYILVVTFFFIILRRIYNVNYKN
jgi:hypothetical protein